jgi:hypothetical protein
MSPAGQQKGDGMYYIVSPEFTGGLGNREARTLSPHDFHPFTISLDIFVRTVYLVHDLCKHEYYSCSCEGSSACAIVVWVRREGAVCASAAELRVA